MRSRLVLLVVAILLVAGFAALNWSEVIRPAPLLFGPVVADAPLGAILLALLALAVVAFTVSAGAIRTGALMESRHHYKELEAQRLLADKAEASRFTELRTHLDTSLRELREHDTILTTEWQRELRTQMEQHNRAVSARLNELEHRLESRFERMGMGKAPVRNDVVPPVRNDVVPPVRNDVPTLRPDGLRDEAREHAAAQQVREQQLRDERVREEGALRREDAPSDRPAESGWRRWF